MVDTEHLEHEDWQADIGHVEGVLRLDGYAGVLVFARLAESQDATHRFVALSILPSVLTGEFKDTPEVQQAVQSFEREEDPIVFEAYQMMIESTMPHQNPPSVPNRHQPRHVRRPRTGRHNRRTVSSGFNSVT